MVLIEKYRHRISKPNLKPINMNSANILKEIGGSIRVKRKK